MTEATHHVSCRYKPPLITWLDKDDNFQKFPMMTFNSNYDKTISYDTVLKMIQLLSKMGSNIIRCHSVEIAVT